MALLCEEQILWSNLSIIPSEAKLQCCVQDRNFGLNLHQIEFQISCLNLDFLDLFSHSLPLLLSHHLIPLRPASFFFSIQFACEGCQ